MFFINGENLKDLLVGFNLNRFVLVVNISVFLFMNLVYYIYVLFKMIVKIIKIKLEKSCLSL